VEVLHGNQPGSKHSRRRADKHKFDDDRALDWSEHETDISLFPHSPLALEGVLIQDLQAESETAAVPIGSSLATSTDEKISTDELENRRIKNSGSIPVLNPVPISANTATSSASKNNKQRRSNLLTRLNGPELLEQCKKILVENALVQNKDERQLYLSAGFISWPSPENPQIRQRAPVLLYPALLVRVTDQQRYEVRLTGDTPEFNNALQEHIEQRFTCLLPSFNEDMALVDYFAQVAESIHSADALTIDFDVALGSARLNHHLANKENLNLPALPLHFDAPLAMSITGNKSLNQLAAVLSLIPDFSLLNNDINIDTQGQNNPADIADIAELRRFAAKLSAEGLDHVEFRRLPALPELIDKWIGAMKLAASTHTLIDVLNVTDISVRELIKLAGVIELIDKAPDEIDKEGHADLCYSSSTTLLRRARHQAKLIEEELQALSEHFVLDRIPQKSQLLHLIAELGGALDREPDVVDADYFNARRQFLEFSTQKVNTLTFEHRRQLSQLAKVLRFRELFVNNAEYRAALGPAYKGLRTDWQAIQRISEYARELSEVLGSENLAASIVANWHPFRASFAKDLDVMQQGSDASRRVLGLVGAHWQTQSIPDLIQQATLISSRLEEWQDLYEMVGSHAHKTPAMVLSSFSGKSMDDVVVESHADETQTRINAKLAAGEISLDEISDTLNWLQAASDVATRQELDINVIVERLRIA